MTKSRTPVARRKLRTLPRRVSELVFRLQNEALSALREKEWPGALLGERIADDEELLQLYFGNIAPALESLETYLPKESRKNTRRNHAFDLLLFLLKAAHFIGSRARMSSSQRNYFASKQAAAAGLRSAAKRAGAPLVWQQHTLELALRVRKTNPKLSQARTATAVLNRWEISTEPPEHRTVRDYISLLEKCGRLPPRRT